MNPERVPSDGTCSGHCHGKSTIGWLTYLHTYHWFCILPVKLPSSSISPQMSQNRRGIIFHILETVSFQQVKRSKVCRVSMCVGFCACINMLEFSMDCWFRVWYYIRKNLNKNSSAGESTDVFEKWAEDEELLPGTFCKRHYSPKSIGDSLPSAGCSERDLCVS